MPLNGSNQTNWFHKDYDFLKVKPEGMKDLTHNYSQVWQDIFALVVNDAKRDGTFLEIGGAQPFIGNNTWLLEEKYNWSGVSVELDQELCSMWEGQRPNTELICGDALEIPWDDLDLPSKMDYLSFDLEPPKVTLDVLKKFPLDRYQFNCITYEHDMYRDWGDVTGHRDIFSEHGYDLVGFQIHNGPCCMEDWYIHESIPNEIRNKLRSYSCQPYEVVLDQ
tara:strand:+ start:199 stop:861 length:663 start_codon:yes stop_codon:yes gene_type:complete